MLLQLAGTIRHTFRVLPTVILAVSRHTFSSETAAAAAAASHYEVLGVDRTAAPADIKKAFRLVGCHARVATQGGDRGSGEADGGWYCM